MGKMRILLWIASLLFLIKAEKEPLDNLDQLLDDPDIWQYIEKRVEQGNKDQTDDLNQVQGLENESSHPHKNFGDKGQNSENRQSPASKSVTGNVKDLERNHHRFPYFKEESNIGHFLPFSPKAKTISDSSGNSCTYRQNSSLIIRSKKSLENGAAFLKSATHLSSEDCATKCCYTQNCNLAVYEDKEERSCYLFDCGVPSKCLFAPHANYTLMSFHETNSKMGETQQHHENELENLGKTLSPQVQTTLTPAPKIDKVPLYGDCDWGQTCADKNAECRNEQCKCKEGYHAIYAYCRKVCQSDEFQCKNKGQDNKVPDCIDKKHWCDGIPQCADGSDEENCPDQSQADFSGSSNIGNNNQGKISQILPVINNKASSNTELEPVNKQVFISKTDEFPKVSSNQFYGQGPDKTSYLNPNLYGNNNQMIPQQLQEYYWLPQQQGLLNNHQYPPSYPDYPQFQGQQMSQRYFNSLGYGQKFGSPYSGSAKTDSNSVNPGYISGHSQNQNLKNLDKLPVNQDAVNSNESPDYQESFKLPYNNFNGYQNQYSKVRMPKIASENITRSKDNLVHKIPVNPTTTTTSTSTTVTTTTSTTTSTTTTTPNVMTTSEPNVIQESYVNDDFYPNWSENSNHYYQRKQHKQENSDRHKPMSPNFRNRYEGSNKEHYKSKDDNAGEDSYHQRYPYRFRQKGKYADYDSRIHYNWPEYYDDRSDYPDFHQQYPGKKAEFYDGIFDGDQKDQEFLKKDDDQHKTDRTPSPLPPAVPKEEESGETNEDLDIESNEKEKHEESMKKEDSSEKNKEKKIQEEHEIKPTSKVTPIAKVIKTTDKPSNLDEAADKVLIKSPTDSNQGPIVALALGLGICLMLLIFVGCRLRTVKRRIRRGKSLHSNEADYLINGMYL